MKTRIISLISGVLTIVVFFTSAVLARQPESREAVMQRYSENMQTQVERMADDPAEMKEYVLSQDDITGHYKNGNTLLHYAANRGYLDIVTLLLKKGADINARNDDGRTPLHEAMSYRRYEVARFLIVKGANTSLKNKDGETPLIAVVYMDDKKLAAELVNFFIEKGFNVKKSADAKLLNESIGRGHKDVALILLKKGVTFNEASLYTAARQGYEDVFAILLSKGANPRQDGILRAACGSGNLNIVKTLVQKGEKPLVEDVDFAVYHGRAEAAAYLNDLLEKSGGQQVDLKKRCTLEPDGGHCKANFSRGFYNQKAKKCGTFSYGGCNGTVPFDSEEACRRICEQPR